MLEEHRLAENRLATETFVLFCFVLFCFVLFCFLFFPFLLLFFFSPFLLFFFSSFLLTGLWIKTSFQQHGVPKCLAQSRVEPLAIKILLLLFRVHPKFIGRRRILVGWDQTGDVKSFLPSNIRKTTQIDCVQVGE